MRDSQHRSVSEAEAAAWRSPGNGFMHERTIEEMVEVECAARGARPPALSFPAGDAALTATGSSIVVPPWAARPLPVSHMLAHVLTPREFPRHGVEFAGLWLALLGEFPRLRDDLLVEMESRGVRHDLAVQARDTRRRLVDMVNNRPGCIAELVLADPPETRFGRVSGIRGLVNGAVLLNNEAIPLDRIRYASASRRPNAAGRRGAR